MTRYRRKKQAPHYKKTAALCGTQTRRARRKQPRRPHRTRPFLLLVLLLLCILTYRHPQEAQNILSNTLTTLSRIDVSLPDFQGKVTDSDPADSSQSFAASEDNPFSAGASAVASGNDSVSAYPAADDFEVHFLDVGEGLSVLVRTGEHALLYDGGGRDTSSFVVSYLKRQEIESFDYIIASHYDADHLSGLIGVLHTFSVETVIGPDYVHDSNTYESFLDTVDSLGYSVVHPDAGDTFPLGDAYFTVLAPSEITDDSNNNSIVIRIVCGDTSFLLMGDAEQESEERICSLGLPLSSDVLCPGHHGSSDATGTELLRFVQPQYAVISVGADNEYGHPHQSTLNRLADAGVEVLRTDELGTIIACSDGAEITWSTEK